MNTLTRKSLGLAIVTALVAVGLFALASPAGAYAPAPGPGATLQSCPSSTTLTGNPLGVVDTPTYFERYQSYQAIAHGWAIDPQAGSGPIDVRVDLTVYRRALDGSVWTDVPVSITTTTNFYSQNTCLLGLGLGSQHAFQIWWQPPGGAYLTTTRYSRVDACVTAINVGWGRDTSLGCQTVWQG
jgi:hypothetical protein